MKIGIISDTHGHEGAWVRACEQFFTGADLILHAGDVAYHGPRNPMKADYNPMGLIERINASEIPVILAKGNCDSDVDASCLEVLRFLILRRAMFCMNSLWIGKDKMDQLVKAAAAGGELRIFAAVTTNLVAEAMRRHDCWPVAAAALGRTMTGALLFAANLKNKESVTIKFKGDGPLGTVTADATAEGYVRGYVDHPHVHLPLNAMGKIDVGGGIGRGLLSVTRFTGLKEPVTGSVHIVNGEIAEDLISYLYTSEQTPSSIGLGVLVSPELECLGAGGFFVQPMPGASGETLDRVEENLKTISSVSHMVEAGLDAAGIIEKVFGGFDDVKILSATDLSFRCNCSKNYITDRLLMLGEEDLRSLRDDGRAEVKCHFCGAAYNFDREELSAIYNAAKKMRAMRAPVGA